MAEQALAPPHSQRRRPVRDAIWAVLGVPAYPALVVLLLISLFVQPRTLSLPFLMIVLRQAAPLGLVALGQRLPIIGRSVDLSAGGVMALVNVILAMRMMSTGPAWLSIVVPLAIGAGVGLLNALLIAYLRASAVVVTLGVSVCLVGLSYVVSNGAPGGEVNGLVRFLSTGRIATVPLAAIIWFALALLFALVVSRTVFRRNLDAIGSNYHAARLAGLPFRATLVWAHVLSGVLAAAAGILLTGYIGTGTLNLGADLVLASVAAVILGGNMFGSGRGGIAGVIAGALVLTYLSNLLTSIGVPEPFKLIVQGLIVVVAAALAARRRG